MFTWIKKRCRRNSAPSDISNETLCPEFSETKTHLYFELEDQRPTDHFYEEIPEVIPSSCLTAKMAMQVTTLTEQLLSGISSGFDKCFICGKSPKRDQVLSSESLCSCYLEPLQVYENDYSDVTSGPKKRSLDDYDIPHQPYSSDHVYMSLASNKRRRLLRSRSDIRKRPLPELPPRRETESENDSFNESDSSGFYEKIDSDSDDSIVGPYMSDSILV